MLKIPTAQSVLDDEEYNALKIEADNNNMNVSQYMKALLAEQGIVKNKNFINQREISNDPIKVEPRLSNDENNGNSDVNAEVLKLQKEIENLKTSKPQPVKSMLQTEAEVDRILDEKLRRDADKNESIEAFKKINDIQSNLDEMKMKNDEMKNINIDYCGKSDEMCKRLDKMDGNFKIFHTAIVNIADDVRSLKGM